MVARNSAYAVALLLTGVGASTLVKRLDNGVGVTPALGWNNYNAGVSSSEESALAAANAFVSLGLKELGYVYVNIDDAWSTMQRDGDGNLVADPAKFPSGVKNLTDKIHTMGLKFGLYGDSGTATCSGFPGSQGHEEQDAELLASWGVDYWKYDNCNTPSGDSQPRYETMRNALLATNRTILYSLCQWGVDSVWEWGKEVGNSWRVGGDITNNWNSVANIAASNAAITSYAGPGGFNDYDMMEIGNGALTEAEERAHFGLWSICKSPLLLGTDLTKISNSSLAIVKNAAIIAINQDSLGRAASTFTPAGADAPTSGKLYPYWSGPLSDGFVVALVAANGAGTLSASFADVPDLGAGTYSWTEVYSGKTGKGDGVSWTFEAEHDMAVFKVTGKVPAVNTTTTASVSLASSTTGSVSTSTTKTASAVTSTAAPATSTEAGQVGQWGQCGGTGYSGSTVCVSPLTCHEVNEWYSQCY